MKTTRLTLKLFGILGPIVLIIIAAHSLLYHYLTRAYIGQQIFLRGENLAHPLWQKVHFNLKVGGNERSLFGLSHLCSQIKNNNPDLLEVAVINDRGLVLAHNDLSRLWKNVGSIPLIQGRKHYFNETDNALDTYLPVYREKGLPLLVKVSFSKKLFERQSWKVFLVSLGFSFTVVLLLLIIVYVLTNFIFGKRIAVLLEGFKILAQGDFKVRLSSDHIPFNSFYKYDELDLLLSSFDQTAEKLEAIKDQQEIQEKRLTYLATHDELTGLPNRRFLEERLQQAIIKARDGAGSVLLFMDMDNFKFVNDTLGHNAGDKVLVALTGLLKEQLQPQQILARFGGDEFALLMENGAGIEEGKKLAAQICRAVEEFQFTLEDSCFYFGLSIGIVPINGAEDSGVLLARADNAMYQAKKMGKNRYEVYNQEEESNRLSRTAGWIAKLKDALANEGFLLYFQPIVNLNTKQVEYYEALLRLKDEGDKVIPPDEFIKIAEEFGLMPQIDHWVVERVINILKEIPEIKIFINLSAISLADDGLLKFIEDFLVTSKVEPSRIGFEITETAAIKDLKLTGLWINSLKRMGCRFALDDFGSGFNSFVNLRNLPVNQLKLDGSFIQKLDRDPVQRSFVETMHQLASTLGIETVAEFVENEQVLKILTEIGINYGQGFYLGKPGPIFKLNGDSTECQLKLKVHSP